MAIQPKYHEPTGQDVITEEEAIEYLMGKFECSRSVAQNLLQEFIATTPQGIIRCRESEIKTKN